jgi:hypothetical protein
VFELDLTISRLKHATTAEPNAQIIVEYRKPPGIVVPSSSTAKSTPASGAPNAAETPAAAPTQINSVSGSIAERPAKRDKGPANKHAQQAPI